MKYTVKLKFTDDGSCHFYNVSESDLEKFDLWISRKSENSIMEFAYKNEIYYLNRDFFCYGSIKEEKENLFEKKKKELFK